MVERLVALSALALGSAAHGMGNGLALTQADIDTIQPDQLSGYLDLHQFEIVIPLLCGQRCGG